VLGALQLLVGTWTNQPYPNGKGGPDSPYSYNLMVLPQSDSVTTPEGFILKNMQYYEEITFSPIHGNAANRGGTGVQVCNPLFYEQRIYISEASGTPATNTLVHAENGSWLVLSSSVQLEGPYSTGPEVPGSTPPTGFPTLVKQISVPHGNSVLALGEAPPFPLQPQSGTPSIPDLTGTVIPAGVGPAPYTTPGVGNPNTAYTANPNAPLAEALGQANVVSYIKFQVDTAFANSKGMVTNIGYEERHANVMRYSATYWLEQLEGSDGYDQLQYSQTITLEIPLHGTVYKFPHVTSNTLTRVEGLSPSTAGLGTEAQS
ncbi:MAG TPA: heme-binding protein, partial [Allosphingosinicella sp.]